MKQTYINKAIAVLLLSSTCMFAQAAPKAKAAPKALTTQIQKLGDLISDGYAVRFDGATYFQDIKLKDRNKLVLTVFTMEGFGGGNNHGQFLALFEENLNENNVPYYTYSDHISIGGKGWRGVDGLNAKVVENKKTNELTFSFDALEVGEDDAPNFPSKKVVVKVVYAKGELSEVGK